MIRLRSGSTTTSDRAKPPLPVGNGGFLMKTGGKVEKRREIKLKNWKILRKK
jgi:hypothetical protein